MMSLADLQDRFQRHIVHDDRAITADIVGPDEQFRHERLGIYYSAYRLRLIAALAIDYPVLQTYTKQARFKDLATGYIDARPSMTRNLRWFGEGMAEFLRNDARFSAEPVLAELAGFEWAQGLAFDAADATQLDFDALASVPPEDWPHLRFVGHTSLQLIQTQWNVVAIWHAQRENRALPPATRLEQPATIGVWRKDDQTYFRSLDRDEAWLWRSLAGGTTFGDACSRLALRMDSDDAGAAQSAASLLRTWVNEGWIQAVSLGANTH